MAQCCAADSGRMGSPRSVQHRWGTSVEAGMTEMRGRRAGNDIIASVKTGIKHPVLSALRTIKRSKSKPRRFAASVAYSAPWAGSTKGTHSCFQ